jgi:uracil-DNA glycosylase
MTGRQVSAPEVEERLRSQVVACELCPRLVEYRLNLKPRPAFASREYWRKPVPGFGDLQARLLVLGLAPASHGGARTGRIFTGDASSRFLVAALNATGFANQPTSESREDGLVYTDCYLTAAVKCAPPADRPLPEEVENCSQYLEREISMLRNLKSVLALGSLAFRAYLDYLRRRGTRVDGLKFGHGGVFEFEDMPTLYSSFHPSPRNTNTGKLTPQMLVSVLRKIKKDLAEVSRARG